MGLSLLFLLATRCPSAGPIGPICPIGPIGPIGLELLLAHLEAILELLLSHLLADLLFSDLEGDLEDLEDRQVENSTPGQLYRQPRSWTAGITFTFTCTKPTTRNIKIWLYL